MCIMIHKLKYFLHNMKCILWMLLIGVRVLLFILATLFEIIVNYFKNLSDREI